MTIRSNPSQVSTQNGLSLQAEATYGYLPRVSVQQSDDVAATAEETVLVQDSKAPCDDTRALAG